MSVVWMRTVLNPPVSSAVKTSLLINIPQFVPNWPVLVRFPNGNLIIFLLPGHRQHMSVLVLKQDTDWPFFPFNQQEHFYDRQSGTGYLAWRLKTVQRNSASEKKTSKSTFQDSPKTHRNMHSVVRQLSGDECKEALSVMRHSNDATLVKDKMKATFQHRQNVVQDPATASTVLDLFPRFLDTPGLVSKIWQL